MIQSKIKYFYFFRGNLSSHVHFFKALQKTCDNNKLNLILITFLNPKVYVNQFSLVKGFRSETFRVIISPLNSVTPLLYFFFAIFFSKKTIIHLKKINPKVFSILKTIFKRKLILVADLEGDLISENHYLLQHKFNNKSIVNEEKELFVKEEFAKLSIYDTVFVRNEYYEKLLKKRHPTLKSAIITSDLMSFKKGTLFFDATLRNEIRLKLGWNDSHIITYIGNIFYPWQHLSKTIRVYKKIKKELSKKAKLLLLIRKADHQLAEEFIAKHELDQDDYYLQEVPHNEMKGYLSASDLGIVIRDFHEMNRVVIPGKLLDYLACGLPVITSSVFGNISEYIKNNNYGLVLETLNLESIQFNIIQSLLSLKDYKKNEISNWANDNLSVDETSLPYIETMKSFNV